MQSPLNALTVYVHEATHKVLDKVFGYDRTLRDYAKKKFKTDPLAGFLAMEYGSALNEGLTEVMRLNAVGQNGLVSSYQQNGFVGAAYHALQKTGGTIRSLVKNMPQAIYHFAAALNSQNRAYSKA